MSVFDPTIRQAEKVSISALTDLFLQLALLIIIITVFVPFSPQMPAAGIDPSWALGLNQAVAQGLAFGKEIIFTYGPFSSIYTEAYHPSTDFMMIGGSLYLAFSYWLCLVFVIKNVPWRWTLAFGICLGGMIYARDSLFFSYPLLVGIANYKYMILPKNNSVTSTYYILFFALLFAPFGLLPLIKASLLLLCIIVAILCCTYLVICKKIALASVSLITPAVAMLLFWIGSGQSAANLPGFLLSTLSISSEFTEAMALEGNQVEIVLYMISSALICVSIACQKQLRRPSKLFLLCLFFVFLFLSCKSGFVRHNVHAFIPATSILITALLLPFVFRSKSVLPLIILSIFTWGYINSHYTRISISKNILSTSFSAWHGLASRLNDPEWVKQNFDLSMNFLKNQVSFPLLEGTTDIYSCKQTYLIASGNTWSPRPIIQSYSVFSSNLAQRNKQHLLGQKKPDNIIFRMEPIDGRIPSSEDGASWPILMTDYQLTHSENDYLFLRKRIMPGNTTTKLTPLIQEKHNFGDIVDVPATDQAVFARIIIKPTFWGYLAITFLKPEPLTILLEQTDGTKKQYRIIASMAKSAFLISPLVENTSEFAMLYGNKSDLNAKTVKTISIASKNSNFWQWHQKYSIIFKHIKIFPASKFTPK